MAYVTWTVNNHEKTATVFCAHCKEIFQRDVPLDQAGPVKQQHADHECLDSKAK